MSFTTDWVVLRSHGDYTLWLRTDQEHVKHANENVEHIFDNPVEYVLWAYCLDCETQYIKAQTQLLEDGI